MANEVDICNLALSNIGQDALVTAIDPPDGSVEADHCERFYPVARDKLLEMHGWRFATFRAVLAEVTLPCTLEGQWRFAYAMPSLVIAPQLILPPRVTEEEKQAVPFEVESDLDGSQIILTNMDEAVLKYTKKVLDTTKFTPMFITALSWLLGSYLAGPITKRPERRKDAHDNFLTEYTLATAGDAKARRRDLLRRHVAGFHTARGFRSLDGDDIGGRSFVETFGP